MIRFQDEHVGGPDAFQNQFGDVAKISEKTEIRSIRAQKKSDRILSIVRNCKGFHRHVTDFETRAGREQAAIHFDVELKLNGFLRRAIAINRNAKFLRQHAEPLNVIAVFVSDENALQTFGRTTDGGEPLANLAPGLQITASVGAAEADHEADDLSELVRRADNAMYRAKDAGRNRVEVVSRTAVM